MGKGQLVERRTTTAWKNCSTQKSQLLDTCQAVVKKWQLVDTWIKVD